TGQNLTWYADADLTQEIPDTTELVNGTTYYVTQTVGDCTSDALAITVTVTLDVDNFNKYNFNMYPNPVSDVLNLKANQEISNIEVFNLLGQKMDNRKSTRLNSSHVKISYAVFCLKKKSKTPR